MGSLPAPLPRSFVSLFVVVWVAATAAQAAERPPAAPKRPAATSPRSTQASPSRAHLISRADRALHDQRYTAAAALYRQAAALDPSATDAPQMAAVAAFLEQYGRTRRDLARAMSRDISPEDRDLATAYLELQGEATGVPAPAADSFDITLRTALGGGFDSNPHRSGTAEIPSELFGGLRPGAPYGTGTLEAALYGSPHPGLEVSLDYTLDQFAYNDAGLADLAYQDQALELGMAQALGNSARLLVTLSGELSLTGMGTALTPFSRALRAESELGLGTGVLQLRLGGGYQSTDVYDRDLTFLGGGRVEARVTPVLDVGGWRASLTARWRADSLGTDRGEPTETDLPSCEGCTATSVIPHSNRTLAVSARLTTPWRWIVRPGLWARAERRTYDRPTLQETGGASPGERFMVLGDRGSTTTAVGATLRWRLNRALSLTARWDYTRFDSFFRGSATACAGHEECGSGSLKDRGYQRQSVGLQLDIFWL